MHRGTYELEDAQSWIILPPGDRAILRYPYRGNKIPTDSELARFSDLLIANLGFPFPWGDLPDSTQASHLWQNHRIGMGGLFHDAWYVTADGRVGGAPNVPEQLPGSLRFCMYLDGGRGGDAAGTLKENEGFALLKNTTAADRSIYRKIQLHAMEHVGADGGRILVSPIADNDQVYVAFSGRCLVCPNIEDISVRQLRKSVPDYELKLFPEWENWLTNFTSRQDLTVRQNATAELSSIGSHK